MKYLLLPIALLFTAYLLPAQTVPTPTQTDEIIIDNGVSGKADPNDRIRYKVTIQNTGASNANGAQLNIVPDPRTTFVPGSFRSSPLALPDAYACTGNVGINVPAAAGLKANDFDDNIAGATVTAGTFATTQGGSIMTSADGSFMYTPPPGFTGTDTYIYTLNDGNGVGGGVPATDMSTVTFTITNLIWFIDNSSVAATSDGRLTSPFKSLADFNAGSAAAAAVVYVEYTGTNYTGGIVLQNSERLFGKGHTGGANLANVLPFSLAANSKTLPAINGNYPIITNASGNGVALASGNTLNGFQVGNCSGNAINGTGFGTLTVANVTINTNGQALSLNNGTVAGAGFNSVTSTGGTNNIGLNSLSGTLALGGGALSGASGANFFSSQGNATVSFSGTMNRTNAGRMVDISLATGGSFTFSGQLTSSAAGGTQESILLSSNTGATFNFSGGLSLTSTSTGAAFSATGGGTVNVTGSGNIISSTVGTALNVVNTTIGASNLNFQSISSTSSAAPTGIILDNTGSSGGLVVTGTGTAGSGGTIANKTGSDGSTSTGIGIYLNSTAKASLSRMQLNDFQNFAIYGNNVTDLSMSNCVINGANGTLSGGAGEGSIYLLNLLGNCSISSCTVSGGNVENLKVINSSGTLNSLNVSGCTIQNNSTVNGNMGLSVLSTVSANMTATVTGCTFKGNRTIALRADAADASILNVTYTGNTISPGTGGNNQGNQGIEVSRALTSSVTFDVSNNNVSGMISTLINIFSGGGNAGATVGMTGVVKSNVVTGTGSGGNQFGIRVFNSGSSATGSGFIHVNVSNNTVSQIDNAYGILVESSGSTGSPGRVEASVIGNNVSVVGTALDCIRVQSRNNHTVCAKVSGNITNSGGSGFYGIQIRQANTSTFSLEGLTTGPQTEPTVHNYLVTQNPAAATVSSDGSVTGTITGVPAGTCSNIPN